MTKAIVLSKNGQAEIELNEKLYEQAHDARCSVPQYLQRQYGEGVDAKEHGTVFNQLLAQAGLNPTKDPATGIGATKFKDAFDGISAAITKDSLPLSRILLPAAVLEMVEQNRRDDRASDVAAFNSLVAVDTAIAGNRYEQPIFDASNADGQELSRIGQLQFPNIVGKLTVAERGGSIPTYSYGLEISDEAIKAFSIDQVAIYLSRMEATQAARLVDNHINTLVFGDKDVGQAALPTVKAKDFDSALTAGKLSHRAYVKWLRSNRRMRTISHVLCDEETYLKLVEREGRPTGDTIYVQDGERLAFPTRPMNYSLQEPAIFIVNDGVLPTDTLVGLDSRFAIARIRNTEAAYKATEELLIRKGQQMRFDTGEVVYRHDDTAWSVLKLEA